MILESASWSWAGWQEPPVKCAAVLRGYTVRLTFSGPVIAPVFCVRLSHWCASRTCNGVQGRQSATSWGDGGPDLTSLPFPAPGTPSPEGGVAATVPSSPPAPPQSSSRSGPAWPPLPQGTLPLCTPRSLEVRASPVHLRCGQHPSQALGETGAS